MVIRVDKIFLIDVEGWLAQFRVHSTITTQLTHLIPSKSTIIGFLLAKLGLARLNYANWPTNVYQKLLARDNGITVGIALRNKSITKFIDYNLYYLGGEKSNPTRVEYIVNPKYTFVYSVPNNLTLAGKNLVNILSNEKQEIFKTYLGINECPTVITKTMTLSDTDIKSEERDVIDTRFIIPKRFVDSIESKEKQRPSLEEAILPVTPPPISGTRKDKENKDNYETFLVPIGNKVKFRLNKLCKIYCLKINGDEERLVMI